MSEDPRLRGLRQDAKKVVEEVRIKRQGWGTSEEKAQEYLAARQHQLDVAKRMRAIYPDTRLGGARISDGIEAVERNISDIKSEIRKLKPGN